MIPLHLSLFNFLSYRECELDFAGIHTACICGTNGAGKSSLLEALTWVLWGKSRAESDDDMIRRGSTEARVDLTFECEGQQFRIIRTRLLTKSSSLDFQVGDGDGAFRTLTRGSIRVTQEAINEVLKMDYETFINSAYLRQGRADEFTLKRPAERKEVLIEILGLNRYERLCERSKEQEKYFTTRVQLLKEGLQRSRAALAERSAVEAVRLGATADLEALRLEQQQCGERLEVLTARALHREKLQQHLERLAEQFNQASSVHQRIQGQYERQHKLVQELETLLQQENQIAQGVQHYQQLHALEANLSERATQHQALTVRLQEIDRELAQERHALELQLSRLQSRLEQLRQQRQETQTILVEAPKIEHAMAELDRAREVNANYDRRQREAFPRLNEKDGLEKQIHAQHCELVAQMGVYEQQARKLQQDLSKRAFHEQTFNQVNEKIEMLEKKRVYQQRVTEKGIERNAFEAKLRASQQQLSKEQLALKDKVRLLSEGGSECPLCGGPLDEVHRTVLVDEQDREQAELDDQHVLLSHQISAAEHEVRVLRQEYQELTRELEHLPRLLQQQAQLRQQLSALDESSSQNLHLRTQTQALKQQIDRADFGHELRSELATVLQEIQLIAYDEKDHAMARSELDRWRWAESRAEALERARKQALQLEADLPPVEQAVEGLKVQLAGGFALPLRAQRQTVAEQLHNLGYEVSQHQQVRRDLQEAQHWLLRQQEWQRARNRQPEEAGILRAFQSELLASTTGIAALKQAHQQQQTELAQAPDESENIRTLQAQLTENRAAQELKFSTLGAIEQRLAQIDALEQQLVELEQQLDYGQHQQQLYKELTRAFGKNGIQALIIENVLPELETETNHLLARLSGSQLHVQFITQRASKNARKLIDTLDILIADPRGTRPYETYSGGEAYRVNFAIRLALSRLLARRSGAALQTLIIDEGFGTQDQEGRDRLVQSINAVADDFACILVITHIHELKEAFQSRIEVEKSHNGSQLSVVL